MASSRPRIGILLDVGTPDENRRVLELPADYPQAVLDAGGLPVLLPNNSDPAAPAALLDLVDALIVPGGRDLDPALWHEPLHPTTRLLDPLRQAFDLAVLTLAEARRLPTLGICLGCQLMNVHRGGSLHQSVPDAFPESTIVHTRLDRSTPENPTRSSFHHVSLRPDTHLHAIYQADEIPSNSRHHQAVNQLGRGLIASAFAPDGLLEALEDYALPFWIGVQWHPENLRQDPMQLKLFQALVVAAAHRH